MEETVKKCTTVHVYKKEHTKKKQLIEVLKLSQ